MADQAADQGARFLMLYFPTRSLLGHEQLDRLRDVLATWCAEKDITLIDMTEDFLANPGPDLYADNLHPGTLGQRLIAEKVFGSLLLE
jgi:lysophospholipase L1-like esterase